MPFPLKGLGLAAIAVGVLAYPGAWALDRACGMDVRMVAAVDEATIALNRSDWEGDKAKVAEIYGTPAKGMERVLFPAEDRILRPKEDPEQAIYLNRGADHPLQAQTVWFLAGPVAVGAIVVGTVLLLLARRRRRG